MDKKQEKLLQDFKESLVNFNVTMAKVPADGLDWVEHEGEWSVRQVTHHVAEDCNVYAFIIERALATPGCTVVFGDFPGNDEWGRRLHWGDRPIEGAKALMHAHRVFLAEMVGAFPDRWENEVHFKNEAGEDLGERNVEEIMAMLTEHMNEHAEMIEKIVAANGAN